MLLTQRLSYDFTLSASALDTVKSTSTPYQTAIGSAARCGDPDGSRLIQLFVSTPRLSSSRCRPSPRKTSTTRPSRSCAYGSSI